MIVTYQRDGSMVPNPSGAAQAFLPDGTGYRVLFRYVQATEGLISYSGLVGSYATYDAVRAHYATYDAITTDAALATNVDVDVACVVTGMRLRNGRSGLFTEIEAGTCDLSILDEVGMFDPRWSDTTFGPGRRVRSGTWVQVSVYTGGAWWPMFTGLVDTWERNIDAGAGVTLDPTTPVSDVRVQCTDAFSALGAADFNGAVGAELTSGRVQRLITGIWQSTWGVQSIAAGTVTLDSRTLDNAGVLENLKAAAAVEDGRVFIARDGTFTFQTATWRALRNPKLTVLGVGANDFRGELVVCSYQRIATTLASYNDVKARYLIYDDMRVCNPSAGGGTTIPQICATAMVAGDSSDDVINEVVLTYSAPAVPSGYVIETGDAVVAAAPVEYVARDDASIKQYGLRTVTRGDLTPTPQTPLQTLANTLVRRWSTGDATVSEVTVDLTAEPGSHDAMFRLWSGDLINVVDRVAPVAMSSTSDEWLITSAEVAGMQWNMTPTRLDMQLNLDEVSAG